jgi:hypothetical protein
MGQDKPILVVAGGGNVDSIISSSQIVNFGGGVIGIK